MSAKYSNSPTLRLPIAESRICAALQAAFISCCFGALVLVAVRGHPWLASPISLLVWTLLPLLWRQPQVGSVVCWCNGAWSLERGGEEARISVQAASRASALAVFLCWRRADGRYESVWLFADSAPALQLRRLRVRLAIEQ